MGINVYPSLSSHAGAITDPGEVLLSILRHIFATPASSSDHYEGYGFSHKVSFRRIEAEHGNRPKVFCETYGNLISALMARYFPDKRFRVSCTYKYIDEHTGEHIEPTADNAFSTRYTVFLDVQMEDEDGIEQPIIHTDMVEIDPKTFEFKIKFKRTIS